MKEFSFRSAVLPLCLITGILIGVPASTAKARSKGVEVSLKAKWNATSSLLEAYEFLVRLLHTDGYRFKMLHHKYHTCNPALCDTDLLFVMHADRDGRWVTHLCMASLQFAG